MPKITLEVFLERSLKVHSNKYNYSQVQWKNTKTKLTIICPEHGAFQQEAGSHMQGHGCKKCANANRWVERKNQSKNNFVVKAQKIHGDRYDYSKSEYTKNNEKLLITCPVHGEFEQSPIQHLGKKLGCRKCSAIKHGLTRRISKEEFIRRAISAHFDKYDYSKVEYINQQKPVTIICPHHGEFQQAPHNHHQGKGCRQCGIQRLADHYRKPNEDFIAELRVVHGDKYNLSLVDYKGAFELATLICSDHGPFTKPAREFLKYGCPQCSVGIRAAKRTLTTDQFISNARVVHGEIYDYSRTQYVKSSARVSIICKSHGEFLQLANVHTSGSGCPKCAQEAGYMHKLLSTKEFIIRANAIQDGRYTYDRTKYTGSKKKLVVTCPEHGDFECYAGNHLKGHGCARCSGYGRTTEEFIHDAREIHNDKYDYSLTEFISVDSKVTIICPDHGAFEQRALGHLHGKGCTGCQRDNWRLDNEDFMRRAREAHGDKYDYSLIDYIDNKTPIRIVCPEHGQFMQKPSSHMDARGCQQCDFDGRRRSTEEFIEAARRIHGAKYDYSQVEYIGNIFNISIECPFHGKFIQTASTHLSGSGCPRCGLSGQYTLKGLLRGDYSYDKDAMLYLYVAPQIRDGEAEFINIGLSKFGYQKRYFASHPYKTAGDPNRVWAPKALAVLLEQMILRATFRFSYEPEIKFAGGSRECRTLEARPLIEEIIEQFCSDPADLLSSPWFVYEAKRHELDHLIDGLHSVVNDLKEQIVS